MARLPDVQPDPVQGAETSLATVQPTDFGLDRVGAELGQTAQLAQRASLLGVRVQAQKDSVSAQPYLDQLKNANQDRLATEGAAYTGAPGFAADQIVKSHAAVQKVLDDNPDMTPGVRSEFQRQAQAETQRVADAAISHEAAVQAKPIAEAVANQQNAQVGSALANASAITMPAVEGAFLNHVPGGTDLVANVGEIYKDPRLADIRATLPANLQPAFDAAMQGQQQKDMAGALSHTVASAEQGAQTAVATSIATLANTVYTAPTGYPKAVAQLPQLVSSLPLSQQAAALRDGQAQLATSRIKGLITAGQTATAKSELEAGTYDAFLTPQERDSLGAAADAAARDHAPRTLDQAVAQQQVAQSADEAVYTALTTGKLPAGQDLDAMANAIAASNGFEAGAQFKVKATNALRAFAAVGPIKGMPMADVAALAHAAPPSPDDPDYAAKLPIWQIQQQAAAVELQQRQDPGAWAFASNGKGASKGAPAASLSQDRGAALQGMWANVLQSGNPTQGGQYAGAMLGAQRVAGIPLAARQIVPQAEAAKLAATVINAQPEARAHAMAELARTFNALPASYQQADGTVISPQAILGRQLLAAHMTPMELSAIVDFGADPAKLGRFTAALNDTTLGRSLPSHVQQVLLTAQVHSALAPFLASVAPLPGAGALAQARIDRTILVARELMQTQHMSTAAAAATAAADLTGGYQYVDGWRIPNGVAGGLSVSFGAGITNGAGLARTGAANLMGALLQNNGENLYAPSGVAANADQAPAPYPNQVSHNAKWVTTPDDAGLALMIPHPDGTWDQVADRYGRPVRASWGQLQDLAKGTAPGPFAPPPNQPTGPNGQPVPAFSKGAGFAATSWAITMAESRGRSGLVSPAGALGKMQVMPDTVATYAPRLGLPVDLNRAQHDDDYNQKIGNAALSDNINHYGASGAGLGLAVAAYNAGQGRLDGYTDRKTGQWHPGWLTTIGDPRKGQISLNDFVARIPIKETREYVAAVLPAALGRLQGVH